MSILTRMCVLKTNAVYINIRSLYFEKLLLILSGRKFYVLIVLVKLYSIRFTYIYLNKIMKETFKEREK